MHKQILVLCSIGGVLLLSACKSSESKTGPGTGHDSAILVTLSKPSEEAGQDLQITGQVESAQSANISTRVMGYITKISVKVGDPVKKGQLLVNISNTDILAKRGQADAMVSEAQEALKNAQKDFDRFTALYKTQSATAKELDNVTLQFNSAKSRLESARQARNEVNAMLAYTELKSPFSGVVTQKWADAGSMANPGMPILTIEQGGHYQINASVPETEINQIKLGQQVRVAIRSISRTFSGKVSQLNPSSQFTGGQYIIKVQIPDNEIHGLYAGMYANLMVEATPGRETGNNQVLVPLSCIVNKDQLTGLYTVSSAQTALLRWVRLGRTWGDKTEVLSGLGKDESFIASSEGKLYNGVPIKIK